MHQKTVREKLEEIRPDLQTPLFKKYYHQINEEKKGAELYDKLGLEFGLDYILSEQTRQKLTGVKREHVNDLRDDKVTQKKIVDKALDFLD